MAFPPKKDRNRRMVKAWKRGASYRELARSFKLNSPATVHKIVKRELAKEAA